MTPYRLAVVAALSLTAAAVGADRAQAAVLLTYTGNTFTAVKGSYTTSDRVTGTVVLAAPLGANLDAAEETALSFDFSDGVSAQTNLNSNLSQFLFSTDGTGIITAWDVNAGNFIGASASTAISTDDLPELGGPGVVSDYGAIGLQAAATSYGQNHNSPGTWRVSAVAEPVPEPASWVPTLLGLTGLAIAFRARRRDRATG